jgi:CRISPR/Cas system Type II protein with McrA/HNH and RuvC-like nuclease domain
MEWFKKYGKTYWAKHLRNNGGWTKRMANKKSRAGSKNVIKNSFFKRKLLDIN